MPLIRRYGRTSEAAMQAIWAGAHYTEAGVKGGAGSNGNGSAMRSACLGVLLSGKCLLP
jgi:ADP-ribosylglycohydrolase